jgi:uncharacterized membrane protein YdbT with pleckstrin-like domain/DNA-directed RNA polymerase subunit RPC12/RpoP
MSAAKMTYQCPHCGSAVAVASRQIEETLSCPECGRPFKPDVPLARQQPDLILPGGERAAANSAAPAASSAQAGAEVHSFHLAMVRRYPIRALGYGLLIAAGLTGAIAGLVQEFPLLTYPALVIAVLAAYRLTAWWLRTRNTTLHITPDKCVLENGVFQKETLEVPRQDVVDLQVSQSTWGRWANVGDIMIQAAANGGDKSRIIRVMAVQDPGAVARLIRQP